MIVLDGYGESELIRKMNTALRGDSDQASHYPAAESPDFRLWALIEKHVRAVPPARLRARIDTGMQELLRKALLLDALASTTLIDQGVSASLTARLQEARQILESGDVGEIISVALDITADPANVDVLEDASAKLRKAGVATLTPSALLLIVFVLITIGMSIGQAHLPGEVQTITADCVANLALALAIADHIKRDKSS
jgi:hypothetical protein